jgi:N-acetylglucosamine-6-phosphate deacetylase
MPTIKITNGQIITPSQIIPRGNLLVDGHAILAITKDELASEADLVIDAEGNYVAPGFIDLHVHGGAGYDFMDGSLNAFIEIARLHACHGTTSMTPTTLSCSREDLEQVLSLYPEACKQNQSGAQFLGMHLEGPYIAASQRGAQDPRFIRDPDPSEYRDIVDRFPFIQRWSAAPELTGSLALGDFLKARGILPAIAHSDAVYDEVWEAVQCGYRHVTHLYSAMSSITRRNGFRSAGVIESAYLLQDLSVEIIADGMHLPAPLLKLVYQIKGSEKTALITDAMRAAGMPPGESILGSRRQGIPVIVEDGVAKLPDRSSFAGSVATADRLVRNMVRLAGLPIPEAVRMMSATPASILGLGSQKGSLEPGKDADIVIFDPEISIQTTIVRGNIVYSRRPVPPIGSVLSGKPHQ